MATAVGASGDVDLEDSPEESGPRDAAFVGVGGLGLAFVRCSLGNLLLGADHP